MNKSAVLCCTIREVDSWVVKHITPVSEWRTQEVGNLFTAHLPRTESTCSRKWFGPFLASNIERRSLNFQKVQHEQPAGWCVFSRKWAREPVMLGFPRLNEIVGPCREKPWWTKRENNHYFSQISLVKTLWYTHLQCLCRTQNRHCITTFVKLYWSSPSSYFPSMYPQEIALKSDFYIFNFHTYIVLSIKTSWFGHIPRSKFHWEEKTISFTTTTTTSIVFAGRPISRRQRLEVLKSQGTRSSANWKAVKPQRCSITRDLFFVQKLHADERSS